MSEPINNLKFYFCKSPPQCIPFTSVQYEYLSTRITDWENSSTQDRLSLCDQYKGEILTHYNLTATECECDHIDCSLTILKQYTHKVRD